MTVEPTTPGSNEHVKALAAELSGLIHGDVLSDDLSRGMYATDASVYQMTPALAVLPRGPEDVAAIVKFAGRHRMPFAPRGSASGLAGECLTTGISIDFSRYMDAVLAVDEKAGTVATQAGCIFQRLNDQLAPIGKKFGPDPASGNRATIGGILGNNATGAHSMMYGHADEHALWMEVVLADGSRARFCPDGRAEALGASSALFDGIQSEIPRLFGKYAERIPDLVPKTDRNRAGYALKNVYRDGRVNWVRLLAGSEGTLAVFTAAELQLVDTARLTWLVQANFDSLEAMSDAVVPVVGSGAVATCELMDGTLLRMARDAFPDKHDLLPDVEATLLIAIESSDEAEQQRRLETILGVLKKARDVVGEPAVLIDAAEQNVVWDARKKAVPLLYRSRGGPQAIPGIEDVCVPTEKVPEYIRGLSRIAEEEDVLLAHYAHIGHGEPHVRPHIDLHVETDRRKFQNVLRKAFSLAWSLGGSISGEHACGLLRSGFLAEQYGELYELLCRIKGVFDPDGIVNPGKVITDVPAEQLMVSRLRQDHPPVKELENDTVLHWDEGQLFNEVDACNGCGVCRSRESGQTMCPTFRAMRTEAMSPRGMANTLRLLITGQLPAEYLTRPELRGIVDGCFNCKACLHECPSAVDVPRLMLELKARRVRAGTMSRAERFLTACESIGRLAAWVAPVANLLLRGAAGRWLLEGLAGIDRTMKLPRLAWGDGARKLRRYLAKTGPVAEPTDRAVYFLDGFACYSDHALARAAVDVLRHNGVEVVVPPQRPSGMIALQYGHVEAARRAIQQNLVQLAPYARDGYRILCTDPTAVVGMRMDWPAVEPTDDAAAVAAAAEDLTAYLVRCGRQGRLNTDRREVDISVAYHASVHTRALHVGRPGLELAGAIPGVRVTDIGEGSCGAAGTYSYQKANADVCRRMGEAAVKAFGASGADYGLTECSTCALRMERVTGRPALHPVKLLAAGYGYPVAGFPG